ncbi:MAG TPA: hypothetical protein VGM59_03700 [Dongiaceae bacterium]|jgi:uncharacterized membrane protein YqiK
MLDFLSLVPGWLWLTGSIALALLFVRIAGVIRYISNNSIAIVEKLWSAKGSVSSGLIALNGEAGYQPQVLRGGYHFFFPFQYRLHKVALVTIGEIRRRYRAADRDRRHERLGRHGRRQCHAGSALGPVGREDRGTGG